MNCLSPSSVLRSTPVNSRQPMFPISASKRRRNSRGTADSPRVAYPAAEAAGDPGNDLALYLEFLAHGQQYGLRSSVTLLHDLRGPVLLHGLPSFLLIVMQLLLLISHSSFYLHRVGQGPLSPFPPLEPYVKVSLHTARAFLKDTLMECPDCTPHLEPSNLAPGLVPIDTVP